MRNEDAGEANEPSHYYLQPPAVPDETTSQSASSGRSDASSPEPSGQPAGDSAQGDPAASADDRLLNGRYRLLAPLGHGGMGTVWRAHDEVVGRDVAIKEARVADTVPQEERQTIYARLRREAWAAARIDHPSVVTVHDVVIEDGRPWIVMELVQGQSLGEVLDEGTLDAQEVARIGIGVLDALVAAHQAQVLHRDVKPGNVLLGAHGRVVLTDFGIAKVEGEQGLTQAGAFVGSPEYTAPERALGQRPGPESDLWSLGVLLYSALEGVSPFQRRSSTATLYAVVTVEPPALTRGPAELGQVIMQLLRKEPSARPAPEDVRQTLSDLIQPSQRPRWPEHPGQAGQPGQPGQAAQPGQPSPLSTPGHPPHPALVGQPSHSGRQLPLSPPGEPQSSHSGGQPLVVTGQVPPPGGGRQSGLRGARVWLVAASVVVVSAVTAVLLIAFDSDDSSGAKDDKSGATPGASASSDPSASTSGSPSPSSTPTGGGAVIPEDWQLHEENEVVKGSIPAPTGYLRSEDDNEVEYSSKDGEYVIGLDHFDDAEDDAVGEANYRLDWYKDVENYSWTDVHGWVNRTEYEGESAARLEATFVPEDYPEEPGRISELVFVKGKHHWHFYVIMPDGTEREREKGQQLFEEGLSRLVINDS